MIERAVRKKLDHVNGSRATQARARASKTTADLALGWADCKAALRAAMVRNANLVTVLEAVRDTIGAGVYSPGDVCDVGILVNKVLDEEKEAGDGDRG